MFGFFSVILLLIYWINKAIALFDNLISDGQTFLVFLEFSILTIPPIIPIIAPLAAFAVGDNKVGAPFKLARLRFERYQLPRHSQ